MAPSEVKFMRKGTRSCRECRRRKIKCLWTSENSTICRECSEHDRSCSSQGIVNDASFGKRPNLRIRIDKLESIIERLSKDHPEKTLKVISETDSSIARGISRTTYSRSESPLSQEQQKYLKSPLFDVFDNDVIQRKNGNSAVPDISAKMVFDTHMPDREKILSMIADEPNILDVLDVAGDWWIAFEDQYSGAKDLNARLSLRDSVRKQLADSDPVTVATGLVCIVMSLQYIRVGIDDQDLKLSTSTARLIERISIAVDQVILSNATYTDSLAGIQLLILKAKQHAETNQLRKAWLRIHSAIQTAQKIDLAKPLPGMSYTERLGRQRFMGAMFETDRFMSMLLGLPQSVDDNFTDRLASEMIADHPDIVTRVRALRRITAVAAGHINDRNASPEPMSIPDTDLIQHTLSSAAASLPLSWWNIQSHVTTLQDPILSHEFLTTQLWFYQIQAFLQLPFMLQAISNPSFEPYRTTCLDSCRNLITIFNLLRSTPVLSAYTCKCDDFQGLLSAIILLVGLLHHAAEGSKPTGSTFKADIELVELTMSTFTCARHLQGGSIARQGIHVLETLSSFLDDAVQDSHEPKEASLFVPYFGTISVQVNPAWRSKATVSTENAVEYYNSLDCHSMEIPDVPGTGIYTDALSNQAPSTTDTGQHNTESWIFGEQQYPDSVDQPPVSKFDWDMLLTGAELEQEWNYVPKTMPATTALLASRFVTDT